MRHSSSHSSQEWPGVYDPNYLSHSSRSLGDKRSTIWNAQTQGVKVAKLAYNYSGASSEGLF